jgi:hypothetical protein
MDGSDLSLARGDALFTLVGSVQSSKSTISGLRSVYLGRMSGLESGRKVSQTAEENHRRVSDRSERVRNGQLSFSRISLAQFYTDRERFPQGVDTRDAMFSEHLEKLIEELGDGLWGPQCTLKKEVVVERLRRHGHHLLRGLTRSLAVLPLTLTHHWPSS